MIKNYEFPKLFHNVVGQILTANPLDKNSPRKHEVEAEFREFNNLVGTVSSEVDSVREKSLFLRSDKKALLRRTRLAKTSNFGTNSQDSYRSDTMNSHQNNPVFKNFLKRKAVFKDIPPSQQSYHKKTNNQFEEEKLRQDTFLDENDNFKKNKKITKVKTQMSSQKDQDHGMMRRLTKFITDKSSEHDKISNPNEVNNKNHRKSGRQSPPNRQFADFRTRSKKTTRFFMADHDQIRGQTRKKTQIQKKTVNFVLQNDQDEDQQKNFQTTSRRGTKLGLPLGQRSSKFQNNFSPRDYQSSSQQSEWTAKTVISIKFSSNRSIKSKKSLRSQESILNMSNHLLPSKHNRKRSVNYRPKTIKLFQIYHEPIIQKKYKSLSKISRTSIEKPLGKNKPLSKFNIQKKKVVSTQKSIKEPSRKIIRQNRGNYKVSILAKKSEPFILGESEALLDINSLKVSATFQDLVYRKNNKSLFKTMRGCSDSDVFTQLNNFQKFMKEDDVDQIDDYIKKINSKPIIIPSEIDNKRTTNPAAFTNENRMIDMGLKLVKRMNMLKQKKY